MDNNKMDLSKLNEVGRLETFLPTKKLSELEVSKNYQITSIRKVQTKYGPRITVDLENINTVFLPARMAKMLNDDDDLFEKMVLASDENQLHLRYLGGQYNQMEFIYV
jgi:hypothetical protein